VFKNKGFLYGLGVGLILGASLLQLMNFAAIDHITISNETQNLSPSILPSTTPLTSIKPIATVKPAAPTKTTKAPDPPSSTTVSTPVITRTEKPTVPTPVATLADPSGITVLIQNGMTSSEVANLLFNKGIILDKKAFDDALSQLKLDRIIRIGSFTFLPNEKDEIIINKITRRK
jgi:hypothetical protein